MMINATSDDYQTVYRLIFSRTGMRINQAEFERVCGVLDELADLTGAHGIDKFLHMLDRESKKHELWQYILHELQSTTHH